MIIPSSVRVIGKYAFSSNPRLKEVTIGNPNTNNDDNRRRLQSKTNTIIIKPYAFFANPSLEKVILQDYVSIIGIIIRNIIINIIIYHYHYHYHSHYYYH